MACSAIRRNNPIQLTDPIEEGSGIRPANDQPIGRKPKLMA